MSFTIRAASENDIPAIFDLISQLAEYEKLTHLITGNEAMLRDALFGLHPAAECMVLLNGLEANEHAGFALYYRTFSTFQSKPGMYLEDLFIIPAARGKGYGKALLKQLASIAKQRGYGRFEWRVLDWNTPSIEFYKSLGATVMPELQLVRMTETEIATLAED